MTHDKYKAALDEINRIFYYEFPVWVSIYKEPKLSDKLMYTIRHALTIAAEYERVKKERDKLADILEDILHSAFEHGSKNLSGKTLDPDGEMLWRAKQLVEKIRGI